MRSENGSGGFLDSRTESGNGRGNQGWPVVRKCLSMNDLREFGNSRCLDNQGVGTRKARLSSHPGYTA